MPDHYQDCPWSSAGITDGPRPPAAHCSTCHAIRAGRSSMRIQVLEELRGLRPSCREPSIHIGAVCSCWIGIGQAVTTVEGIHP